MKGSQKIARYVEASQELDLIRAAISAQGKLPALLAEEKQASARKSEYQRALTGSEQGLAIKALIGHSMEAFGRAMESAIIPSDN